MRNLVLLLILTAGCAATSGAPDLLVQGRPLPPQAVTAVDISGDGRSVAVTTLAFRQDSNAWLLSSDGEVRFGRAVAPWAPFQAAVLNDARAIGT